MGTFGEDLILSLNEALDHAKGEGPAILHARRRPGRCRASGRREGETGAEAKARGAGAGGTGARSHSSDS